MATGTEAARWFDSTAAEYHADAADSFSTLRDFDRNPRLYWLRRVRRTLPVETSDALEFGSAFHCAVLEPERFAAEYAVPPKCDRRTKQGKADYEAWQHANTGKTPLDAADAELIGRMAESVRENPAAAQLLGAALHVERGIRWTCPDSGLELRCRPDLVGSGCVVNLKTAQAAHPDEFVRSVVRHRYHAQAAMDLEGVEAVTGELRRHFLLVVEKVAPWECCVYELNGDALDDGRNWLVRVRRELRARREFDSWQSPRWNQVTRLALPRWGLKDLFDEE